jgi:hypothetical protein
LDELRSRYAERTRSCNLPPPPSHLLASVIWCQTFWLPPVRRGQVLRLMAHHSTEKPKHGLNDLSLLKHETPCCDRASLPFDLRKVFHSVVNGATCCVIDRFQSTLLSNLLHNPVNATSKHLECCIPRHMAALSKTFQSSSAYRCC